MQSSPHGYQIQKSTFQSNQPEVQVRNSSQFHKPTNAPTFVPIYANGTKETHICPDMASRECVWYHDKESQPSLGLIKKEGSLRLIKS